LLHVILGHSEKLEIFTGARWDLPCSCGLGKKCALTLVSDIEKDQQQYVRHCCAHADQASQQDACMLVPKQQNITIYGDSHFYSSYLVVDFLEGKMSPQRAFERCKEHRAGTLLDPDPSRAQLHCIQMLMGVALWHGRVDRAFQWLEYMHWSRRKIGVDVQPISFDTGREEGDVLDEWKVRHDLEQLQYLAKLPPRRLVTPYAPVAPPDFARRLADAYEQLLSGLVRNKDLRLKKDFPALLPYANRGVHVPHVERLEAGATNPRADWMACETTLVREGVATLDDALTSAAIKAIRDYFMESTVWYGPSHAGGVRAQLRDGLHAELLLQMASEVKGRLPRILDGLHFLDAVAHKHDSEWPGGGSGVHALPAAVVVALWVTPSVASLNPAGNGFELFSIPSNSQAVASNPARINGGNARSKRVPYRQNRLVVWTSNYTFKIDWNPQRWRAGYRHRRIDCWLLFGEPPQDILNHAHVFA